MYQLTEDVKAQIKDGKLRQLSAQRYEMQLQQVIYQARGEEQLADQCDAEIAKLDAAIATVTAAEF